MGIKKRMQLSFGSTKEDDEIYEYLKNEVSNASALIRMLVKCYKDGREIGGYTYSQPQNIISEPNDAIEIIKEDKSNADLQNKESENQNFDVVKEWVESEDEGFEAVQEWIEALKP